MQPLRGTLFASLCALVCLGGCKGRSATEAHLALGEKVASAKASDLRATPNGAFAVYLVDADKPRLEGVPPRMVIGELWAVATSGGQPRHVGDGVTNVPGGYTFSPDSRWVLALTGYNPAGQTGTLRVLDLKDARSSSVTLGERVSYMHASPDSKQVAFVADGVLKVGPLPDGPFAEVSGAVQNATFSPDGTNLFFKRNLSAAGGLFAWALSGKSAPRKLGEQVGDYVVSPSSQQIAWTQRSRTMASTYDLHLASAPDFAPRQVALGAGVFGFSRDGKWFGRVENKRLDEEGDLYVGPASGEPGRFIAKKVAEFEFSPASNAVGYLELYDISARAGVLGVAELADGKPKRVGSRVPNFGWSPDGRSVAFVSRFIKPMFSVDLMLYVLGEDAAFKVNPGVFAYQYDPRARYLLFRTSCMNQGRMCDLMKLDLQAPREAPALVAQGVFSFKPAEEGDRVLLSYTRKDSILYDAAVLNLTTQERKTVGQYIELPALFTASDGGGVVYVVGSARAPGVYVAGTVP
jgi:hypothetical protein